MLFRSRWDEASKAAGKGDERDDAAYEAALADAFRSLRTLTLLMHPVVPSGCERIAEMLGFGPEFFSWEHAFEGLAELAGADAASRAIAELPPRFDFFEKHESQR